jgi:hypothetical protein
MLPKDWEHANGNRNEFKKRLEVTVEARELEREGKVWLYSPPWPRPSEGDLYRQIRHQRVEWRGMSEKGTESEESLLNRFYVRDSEREVSRSCNVQWHGILPM